MTKTTRLSSIRRVGALRAHGLNGSSQTRRAREAFLDRFLAEADPRGELPERDRQHRAALLLRAYMVRLALLRHAPVSRREMKNAARSMGGASEVAGASRPSIEE